MRSRNPALRSLTVGAALVCLGLVPHLSLAQASDSGIRFHRVAPESSGIHWTHTNAMSAERHLPETVSPGCAFLDFDGDGWMDIYLVNSGPSDFYEPEQPLSNALYRNNRDGTFTDVTEAAGVQGGTFGMGAFAADYDHDGDTDLFVTAYGRNILYRNKGDGTFADITEEAGLESRGWYTNAVWFDYDNDSHLDLFVAGFVSYSREESKYCGDNEAGRRHYCIPRSFRPTKCLLFRNNGDGTFRDTSDESEISSVGSKSFGAVATDINQDGSLDLFVANDTIQNFLFVNQGNGMFSEEGLLMGVAYSDAGLARSGMGVDAADYDADGWQDLFVSNIDQEMFSLYRNLEGQDFHDASVEVRKETRLFSGWGLKFFDFDSDGDPDLILANGHPDDMIGLFKPLVTHRMRLLLFENTGGDYRKISGSAGDVFNEPHSSRGLAVGDYDNDGDGDVLVSNNGEPPMLLRNDTEAGHGWIGLRLVPTKSGPFAAGAILTWRADSAERSRFRTSGGSYLSSHDPRELIGLGPAQQAEWIEIRWPSGTVDRLEDVTAGDYIEVVEGAGIRP